MDYLELPFKVQVKELWWQKQGLQQSATGYGRKLTTRYMLTLPSERPRRVYAIRCSNVASFYILRNGKAQYIRDMDLDVERGKA